MKTLTSILLAAVLLGTGCIRTSTATSQQKVVAEQVSAVLSGAVASTVLVIIHKNPETKGWFQASNAAICDVAKGEDLSPAAVEKAIAATGQTPPIAYSIGMNMVIGLYKAAWADRARADVAENLYAHAILVALCDGIKQGAGTP